MGQRGMAHSGAAPKRITRADVARLSGVSTAVVSYVLNDGPKPVAAATRRKVMDAVEALGYRPNVAARALSKGTSDMIGLLLGDSRNPFFAELIFAVDRRARERGYSLATLSLSNSTRSLTDHVEDLVAQRAAGIITIYSVDAAESARIAQLGIRTVLINQAEPQQGFASVQVDYRSGAREATEHLLWHGYTSVAFVGADEGVRLREAGWSDALAAAGLPALRPYLTDFSLEGGFAAGRLIAADRVRPRAVFVASDQMAMGLLSALAESGIRVPQDVAVASFDGTLESRYLVPALTTVRQPIDEIAHAAMDALLGTRGAGSVGGSGAAAPGPIRTELVIRRSCGCDGRGSQ